MNSTACSFGKFACLMTTAIAASIAMPAIAQDGDVVEEIVVMGTTIKGIEADVLDTPIAITTVGGAEIEASGIKDMFDIQQNVPGLIVGQSQTATTSNFAIRGVGSTSNNFGVESSVGLYVDDVYRSRQSSIINELIDVQSVDVLRGPQGTLFGKNTASGAINIRTIAPSVDSVDGFIEATGGDYGLGRIAAGANIPLTDRLAFRGTLFASRRDGYVSDEVLGNDVYNDRDRLGIRAQVGYSSDNDFNLRLIADYAEIDESCCVALSRVDSLLSQGLLAQGQQVPGPDSVLMALGATVYTDFPYPAATFPPNVVTGTGFEAYRTALNQAPVSKNEDRGISLSMDKTFGNGLRVTSVTAFRAFDTFDDIDADFTNAELLTRDNTAEQQSFSQELRLDGEFGADGASRFIIGGYYFTQEIKSNTNSFGGSDLQSFIDIGLAAAQAADPTAPPPLSDVTDGVTFFATVVAPQLGIPFFPPGAPAFPADIFASDVVKQDHDSYALFGQVDWALSDSFTLTLGARYTDETKDIDAVYTQTNNGPPPDLNAIGAFFAGLSQDAMPLLAVAQPNAGWGGYLFQPLAPRPDVEAKLDDDQTTGTVKLSWFVNDTWMAYASYATGFKAGGTNADRISPAFSQLFGPETSESAEIGLKGSIGSTFNTRIAVFRTDYDDFQANSFQGTGFNLQNAGKVETQGVELEFWWQPFETLTIQSYYTRNEGDFKSFEGGTCWDATPFHTGMDDMTRQPAPPGVNPGDAPCNRTGFPIPYNPEDRFFAGITKTFPMGANELFVRAEYTYASELFTDGDVDPLTIQDDLGLVNLRIGLNIDSWNSSVTLWGRNVTDEKYYSGSFDPPIQEGRVNSYPSEPATYGITFRKNWD